MKNKEKEIKEKIVNLYNILSIGENEKITNITFYKEMEILPQVGDSLGLEEDIYIVEKEIIKEKDVKEKIYELYLEEGQRVAIVSKEGGIMFDEAYIELLKERYKNLFEKIKIQDTKLNIHNILKENKQEDKVQMTKEEIEKQQSNEEKEESKKREQEKNNKVMQKVCKATGISEKEIRACTQINPNEKITDTENFYDILPSTRQYEKIYVVASSRNTKGNSKFYFIGITKEGMAEQIEDLEPTEGINTAKEVISINRDGSEVKEKQVSALFKVGNYNKGFSVSIGDYGIIEAEYVRRTQDNKYITSNINTTTQKPTTKEVKEFMSDTRNPYMKDNLYKAERQIEENQNTNIKNIDDNDYNDIVLDIDKEIKLKNGHTTTVRKEAEKSGLSLDEYVKRCEAEPADTIEEKIEKVNEQSKEEAIQKLEKEEEGEERTPWGDAYRRMNKN